MSSEIMLSGTSFQTLLLLILVICISVFFFFELRKINLKLISQDMLIQKISDEYKESKNNIKSDTISQEFIFDELKVDAINDNTDINGNTDINEDVTNNIYNSMILRENKTPPINISKTILDIEIDRDSDNSPSDKEVGNESDNESDNESHDSLETEEIIKELQEMSIKELKNILQEKGLAVSGNKTTMIERIIKSLQPLNN